ncbi:MAG: 6-phosphofructokinase [Oligoflexia bacterium]|nr:6-phosphofructokinase [Oligoflexia bacterium]
MSHFNVKKLKHIAVLTSGGDAPGMNAAIRAVVRTGIYHKLQVTAVIHGYQGLLDKEYKPLDLGSVSNIIQRGGTIIKTGRCKDFYHATGRTKAAKNFKAAGFDALVAIGGDGTFTGAQALWKEHTIPIIGVPGTIDNDVYGTDFTIGFDTAVNTGVEAIDKIRDTAASHDRLFIVEVMGRNSGHIALEVGLACGAEEVFIPENKVSIKHVLSIINRGIKRGKRSSLLICAEGDKPGQAYEFAKEIKKQSRFDAKVCILGHIQRGGSPTAKDRNLASRLGAAAVDFIRSGQCAVMAGEKDLKIVAVPLKDTFTKKKRINEDWLRLESILSI